MRFSAFAPFGAFAFSGRPTHGEKVYGAIVRNLGGAFDMTVGGHHEAKAFAKARAIARGMYETDRALAQYDGNTAVAMLPGLERDHGITPGERDTLLTRQRRVAARQTIPRDGAKYLAIKNGLLSMLGGKFVALRQTLPGEAVLSASTPNGNFSRVDLPPRQVLLTDPTPIGTGAVRYSNADTAAPAVRILVGDTLVVQPDNSGLVEVVTVTAVGDGTFTAAFTKGHDAGALASTQSFPNWWSTQRHYLVVLTAAAIADAEIVRQVHEYMERVCRGVTTWAVVQTVGTHTGPFTLGDTVKGQLGTVTLGNIAY